MSSVVSKIHKLLTFGTKYPLHGDHMHFLAVMIGKNTKTLVTTSTASTQNIWNVNERKQLIYRKVTQGTLQRSLCTENGIKEVENQKVVNVTWKDGTEGDYPHVWLRDNCQCSQCYSSSSQARKQLMRDLDPDITADEVKIEGNGVSVLWHDGHFSMFESEWLKQRTFVPAPRIPRELWHGNFLQEVERYKYNLLVEDDDEMLAFLENLARFGFSVIEGMPGSLYEMRCFYNKVGILKPTHYGDDWNIESQYDPNNLAYSSVSLGLHTDLPFYEYTPCTQLIHCIKQHRGEGGENQFADGFAVAERIGQDYPDAWHVLTTVPVEFWDKGTIGPESNWLGTYRVEKFHKINVTPTIRLDHAGNIKQICYNNAVRSTAKLGSPEITMKLYKSLKLFDDLCNSEEFMIQMKLRDGESVWFDNVRVLHGRKGFEMKEGDKEGRHMQGVYIDWDEIYSTINVLNDR